MKRHQGFNVAFTSKRRQFINAISLATAALGASWQLPAHAQDAAANYPSKAITVIVPYAAGGSSDVRARQIAQKLSVYLGQPVIVDNKSGGGGNIGTNAIAKAAPDGYTIGIGNFGPLAVNKTLAPSTPFDPQTDLLPIILIEKGPVLLLVNADRSPYKDLKSLVAALKDPKSKMSYGSSGAGGVYHLGGELFKSTVGASAVHVPYRSGSQMLTDLIAGQVDYAFDMAPSSSTYVKSTPPKLRALAVASDKRLPSYPDVPTFAEQGYKGLEISNWIGMVAPKGTPDAIIKKLNAAINKALQDPEVAQRITVPGNIIGGGSPKDFSDHIHAESVRWTKLIKDKNIKAD
jgi:tripartite-type tricarboxylate transporter receptor subunit TctC